MRNHLFGDCLTFPGHILREKRENLGFSLQDITDHLSIPADIITALESGDLSRIPESGFAAGFLRSYCRFLGIEAEMMIAELQKASKNAKVKRSRKDRSTFHFRFPKLRLPGFSIDLPAELVGWISITALLVLGWVAYTTMAPAADPADANETEATTIDLRVPDHHTGRDAR